jgi:hypothetical protein
VESAAIAECGTNTYTGIHGLQSIGINTKFNLDPIFEIGQIDLYELKEQIPDIEVTMEKCLDGYPLIYHLMTKNVTSSSLAGRSNARGTIGMSIYTDTANSASGVAVAQCVMSGMFTSALNYNMQVNGPFTESVTAVGNNKTWLQSFTAPTFDNTDSPLALSGSGGVAIRQNFIMGEASGDISKFPTEIEGITSSGTNPYDTVNQDFSAHMQSVKVSANLGRNPLYELGKKGPYFRFVQFPVEVRTDIELLTQSGDKVEALEANAANVSNQKIYLVVQEGTKIDLGSKNKLSGVTYGGANAGQQGGNATDTYSYLNYSFLTVLHPQDPAHL